MVSIVSCLSGTALNGRIARKTFVGIVQLIVLVSLTTKQTNAKKAVACYGGQFYCRYGRWFCRPLRCDGGFTVNVLRVTIGSDRCGRDHCCPKSPRCEVSAEEVEPAFYTRVMMTCHGRQDCDGLWAPSHWTPVTDNCEETHDHDSDDDGSGQIFNKYVKIEYNCRKVFSASPPSPSWTTATPDEDLTPEMTTWDDFQTLVMGSRVSDPVTTNDVTTDSGEASGRGNASDQVGVAVGVTVAVLVVVGVITAVLVIYFLRRRKKQMERQIGKDAVASQATPVPNSYDNAFYQEVIPSAPPPTPRGTTRDPPPLDPTASSGNPHPPSPGAAQDTDYDLVRSPYAKVQRRTRQDSENDLRLMENPTYN